MKEIGALAEDLGVQLNLEVVNRFENYLINTCDEVMSYIADVGSPVLHAHLDTFHMNIEENSMSGAIRLERRHDRTRNIRLSRTHAWRGSRRRSRQVAPLPQQPARPM
jgi:D-psicose/D-tagatose/L-ribulose 3-epimerase